MIIFYSRLIYRYKCTKSIKLEKKNVVKNLYLDKQDSSNKQLEKLEKYYENLIFHKNKLCLNNERGRFGKKNF